MTSTQINRNSSNNNNSNNSNNNNNNNNLIKLNKATKYLIQSVPCSIVKSKANIYYNLKIDNKANKAIHYCSAKCTNTNCNAIHKSICKEIPIEHNYNNNQQQQQQQLLNNRKSNVANFIFEKRYPDENTSLINSNNNTHHKARHPYRHSHSYSQNLIDFIQPLQVDSNNNHENITCENSFKNTLILDQVFIIF
jgi:hypothetical protein